MASLQDRYNRQPQLVLDSWSKIIGPEFAPMARAVRFENEVLYVNVKNSTLLSLLSGAKDKQKLIDTIKRKFSGIAIRNIVFRIG